MLVRSKPGHAITHHSYDAHVPTMVRTGRCSFCRRLHLTVLQLSDHRPVISQLVLPCSPICDPSTALSTFEIAFQKLTMSLSSLPPTANGAPPGKPFIRIYLSCGSLPQHAPADDAKFAEIHEGYDKVDAGNPDDQVFMNPSQAPGLSASSSGSEVSPEQEIARGSGSSSVSPHLLAESGLMVAAPSLVSSRAVFASIHRSSAYVMAARSPPRWPSALHS